MKKVLFTISALLLFSLSVMAQADRFLGVWITASDSSSVEIYKHTNGKYIGVINWLLEPNEDDGTPKLDNENPDPEKAKMQIMEECGITVVVSPAEIGEKMALLMKKD